MRTRPSAASADAKSSVACSPSTSDTPRESVAIEDRDRTGGMSTVYKALDLQNASQPVAVKVLSPMYSSGLGSWSNFQREAEIGGKLRHL